MPKKYQVTISYFISDFIENISKEAKIPTSVLIRILANYGLLSVLEATQGIVPDLKALDLKNIIDSFYKGDQKERTRQLERFYFEVRKVVHECYDKRRGNDSKKVST